MLSFKQQSLLSMAVISLCIPLWLGAALSQEGEIQVLKRQLGEMQQQMQKLLLRIEQIEKKGGEPNGVESGTPSTQEQQGQQSTQVQRGSQSVPQSSSSAAGSISRVFNPAISVNSIFVGGYSSSPSKTTRFTGLDFYTGFNFQEAEFRFSADVDPYWRADFILAINRGGEMELEEGYVTSVELPYDLLPRNTSLKLGKFYPAFGKHNLLHAHQFPFIDQPLISQSIFGGEGLTEPGVDISYLLPTAWFSELTFQALAGENEGLFRADDGAKRRGAYLGHWKNFFDLGDETTLEWGQSYIGGRNSGPGHNLSQAVGTDLTLKWRPLSMAQERGLIWQSEYMYFTEDLGRDGFNRGGGLYSSLQYQFARRWWVQGRYDIPGIPKFKDGRKNRLSTLLAFVPSEFSAVRLQYSYTAAESQSPLNELLLQFNYTIGSHPAHKY